MKEYTVKVSGKEVTMQLDEDEVKRYEVIEEKSAEKPTTKKATSPRNK